MSDIKKVLLTLVVVVIVLGGGFYAMHRNAPQSASVTSTAASLTVSPQNATSSVLVDNVTLPVDGYVVLRGVLDGRLSQIVEISHFLPKGVHTNININFAGENTDNAAELVAMIYADNGDQSFSGVTRSYKDANGHMVAVYVKTGLPVPATVTEPDVMVSKTMGMAMATVHYTNAGFVPKTLAVPVGTMVQFINDSDSEMWVASNPHPQHNILPTFDEFESVPKGSVYTYVFDKKGTWPYHDHINAAREGVIKAQ